MGVYEFLRRLPSCARPNQGRQVDRQTDGWMDGWLPPTHLFLRKTRRCERGWGVGEMRRSDGRSCGTRRSASWAPPEKASLQRPSLSPPTSHPVPARARRKRRRARGTPKRKPAAMIVTVEGRKGTARKREWVGVSAHHPRRHRVPKFF